MTTELKLCPFCGGIAEIEIGARIGDDVWYEVYCVACEIMMKGLCCTKKEAIEAWNKRHCDVKDVKKLISTTWRYVNAIEKINMVPANLAVKSVKYYLRKLDYLFETDQ